MKKKRHYINAEEPENEIILWKRSGEISERLGTLFMLLAENLAKSPKFSGYSNNWKQEMINHAVLLLCTYGDRYDPAHPKANVFSYTTQIAFRGFLQVLNIEKKQSNIKQGLIDQYLESHPEVKSRLHNIETQRDEDQ